MNHIKLQQRLSGRMLLSGQEDLWHLQQPGQLGNEWQFIDLMIWFSHNAIQESISKGTHFFKTPFVQLLERLQITYRFANVCEGR